MNVDDSQRTFGCIADGIQKSDRAWIRQVTSSFNSQIRAAARTAGVEVADMENAFAGHEICTADPYANGINLPVNLTFHPNATGYFTEYTALRSYLGY